ncbi:MAG TPA: C4-type zinc ribbon domain-containing protein [Acidimicrobiales bacterium]
MSDTDALRSLMEADRWMERVRAQRTHLPEIAELAELEAQLRGQLSSLREAEALLTPVLARSRALEAESERLRLRAKDLDDALSSSTAGARELSAIQGELGHVRELLSRSEDVEIELLEESEPLAARIEEIKASAQPGVHRRAELLEVIKGLQSSLDDEVASLAHAREETARAVPVPLRVRYQSALERVGTSGAELVVEGRCDGCRLRLSPLDLDHLKAKAPDDFMDCPECGRILLR